MHSLYRLSYNIGEGLADVFLFPNKVTCANEYIAKKQAINAVVNFFLFMVYCYKMVLIIVITGLLAMIDANKPVEYLFYKCLTP